MTLSYRWLLVAIGALMTCVAVGAMFSLAVFLEPISAATNWSRTAISSAMTLNFLAMGVASFGWGAASDRFGPRPVVLAGSVLLGLGLVLASRATSVLEFQLEYGLLVGIAAGSFFAPLISATTMWFDTHRGLAVSLVSAGVGVAPMTISPFARWLISAYDWQFAMLAIGITAWVMLIPAGLLVRLPRAVASGGASGEAAAPVEEGGPTLGEAFRSPQFIVLALTFTLCCSAHSGPIFHMVSYAMICGIPAMSAVSIYSVEGLAGLGGRLLLGVLADRYGVKFVLIAGLLVQALAIGAYLYVNQLGEFYALAVVFGAAYGGVMPLYAVLAREYFGQAIMGSVLGAATMLSCMGMAFGPWAGGWVFDNLGSYAWLYIGSAAVALGAVLIAFAFPSQSSRVRGRLQAA
jgi:MFS family permease